jgi:hypothetical protein
MARSRPQWLGSDWKSVQMVGVPLAGQGFSASGAVQAQMPSLQAAPAMQAFPQAPQFLVSVAMAVQM